MIGLDPLSTILEVVILSIGVYAFIRFLQETRGSAVLKGFIVFTLSLGLGFFTLVRAMQLRHLEWIAERGFQILVVGLVIIFQPELRQAMVRLGESRILRRFGQSQGGRTMASEVAQAVERLARRGLGAIIIVEREVGIAGFTEGGIILDALVSAPLLVSIFFKDTPLHDGAVIIRGRRIVAAGCVLPLSENPKLSRSLGTRHRAAVGATEENDAIAIIVSEETQRISVAIRGELEIGVDAAKITELLHTAPVEES